MPTRKVVPRSGTALAVSFEQFAANIGPFATTLGLPAGDVTGQLADSLYYRYALGQQDRFVKVGQQWTSWKTLVRDGGEGSATSAPAHPAAPASPPPAVAPGILPRFRAVVRRVKASANYSVPIGTALGIEGGAAVETDDAELQPVLEPEVKGDQVHVGWTKGSTDGIEIQVDRDGHGFVFLAIDTVPDYIDTTPLPATPAVWKYRAIYREGDEKVGQWSAPVSVPVGT